MAGEWQAPRAAWTSADAVTTADLDRIDRINPEFLRNNIGKGMGYPRTVAYDAGTDTLTVTFDPVRVRFGGSLVEKAAAFSHQITPVAINTTYYVFLVSSGATSHNTTGVIPAGAIPLCQVAVGATKTALTLTDLRGTIDATGKIAQDNLDTHKAAAVLDHPDGSVTDAKLGNRAPDQTLAPASPGSGTLSQVLSWLANRVKAITGAANWWDNPAVALATLVSGIVVANMNADMVDGVHGSDMSGAKIITLLAPDLYYLSQGTASGASTAQAVYSAGTAGSLVDFVDYEFLWEAALAAGRSVYFEAILYAVSATTTYAALRNAGGTLFGQVSTTSTTAVRVRSAALSLPDATSLYVAFWNSNGAGDGFLKAARLVIK